MSVNQSLKPITTKRENNLTIGGCDLVELAKTYGTPLYVIDEVSLREICKEYKSAFKDYKNINMMYASKALCSLATSKIIADEGFGFDTVSAGEIYTVHKAGANMSKVLFNGNNKTSREIELAIDLGVGRFSVDNFYEAELLNQIAGKKNTTVSILLRVAPGIECHTHEYIQTGQIDSKFGFDLTQTDEILNKIQSDYSNLKVKGLHAHIGSQIFEPKSFEDEIDILIKELARINSKYKLNLNELNIGGGLGVTYTNDDNPPSVEVFAASIKQALKISAEKYSIEEPVIYIEPGRSIISTAGVTLYSIGSSKQVPNGRKYIAIDGGMADNPRPAMYQAVYSAEIANKKDNCALETVTIAGRFCESGDILIEKIILPKPEAGDILCVYNTGAYNYSMASNYNRVEKPAMVLVNNSQSDMIVNRESLEDLVLRECIPDRLK
ncbi:MAG: diaminopimelate decarboxylase [Cyanobacteria bacterium SIG28]|nr:diaminopimelate decarboxylase [Cyanobacteria bacterium SIG28]